MSKIPDEDCNVKCSSVKLQPALILGPNHPLRTGYLVCPVKIVRIRDVYPPKLADKPSISAEQVAEGVKQGAIPKGQEGQEIDPSAVGGGK